MVRRSSARSLGSELLLDFGGQVIRRAGDAMLDFFGDVYGGTSDRVVSGLARTEQQTAPRKGFFKAGINPAREEGHKLFGTKEPGYGGWRTIDGREAVRGQKAPSFDQGTGKWEAWYKRKPEEYGEGVGKYIPEFAQKAVFENPDIVGGLAGTAAVGGVLGAGGLAAHLIGEHTPLGDKKPKSAYGLPVETNANIAAANVSYQNQAALEEQKFNHHMALQAAREQSRIPGPQNTSAGSYGGGPYSSGDLMGMAQGIANQKYKFG
jgi:hypothetical protein